jgi:hypothetical protein
MTKFYQRILIVACFTLALASMAQAQATRTWVSGVGDDANPCSRTAPCKTFAGAISKTAASGEIDCLDPGGFGAVTITKSITIDGTHGAGFGGILSAGTPNAILVNDGSTGTPNTISVTLKSLSINGAGTGANGINFIAGKVVNIEDCQIFGMTSNGVNISLAVSGSNVNIKNTNIFKVGTGVSIATTSGFITASLDNCHIENNTTGVNASTGGFATIRNSIIDFNTTGVTTANGNAVTLEGCEVNHNSSTGFNVVAGATGRLSDSMLILNGTNIANTGTIVTWNNNRILEASIPGVVTSLQQH